MTWLQSPVPVGVIKSLKTVTIIRWPDRLLTPPIMTAKTSKWCHFWVKYIILCFFLPSSKWGFNLTFTRLEWDTGISELEPAGLFTPSAMPVPVMARKGLSLFHFFLSSTIFLFRSQIFEQYCVKNFKNIRSQSRKKYQYWMECAG